MGSSMDEHTMLLCRQWRDRFRAAKDRQWSDLMDRRETPYGDIRRAQRDNNGARIRRDAVREAATRRQA